MEILEATVEVTREAESLTARFPFPVQLAVGLLTLGFRLAQGSNHEDVIGTCKHLADFKTMPAAELKRWITWRFVAEEVEVGGVKLGVTAAAERYEAEVAFRHDVHLRDGYEETLRTVQEALAGRPICLLCADPERHDRRLIVPMGGDVELIARLAREYEEGF
jgi:hypothetical protein